MESVETDCLVTHVVSAGTDHFVAWWARRILILVDLFTFGVGRKDGSFYVTA